MNPTALRAYVTACLAESVIDDDHLSAFLAQPDVAANLAQIEQLTRQLVDVWQMQTAVAAAAVPVAQSAPVLKRKYSFLAPRPESGVPTWANVPRPAPVLPTVSLPPDDVLPTPPPADPVQFKADPPPTPAPPLRTLSIPNATVGKPYAYTFDFTALGMPDVIEPVLDTNNAPGLTYDRPTQTLSGTPAEAGEFNFSLSYRLQTGETNRPVLHRSVQLLINPDPRSLWKDLPSDSSDPYYKPDADQKLIIEGDVRLLAASVRGRSHAHEGKFRDDDFSLAYLAEPGCYLLSVADGAGSAKYSRRGSAIACQTVATHLQQQIAPDQWAALAASIDQYAADPQEAAGATVQRQLYAVLGNAVFAAYKAIETEAKAKPAEPKDFATTLISVLAKPLATGWFVGAFWVGDGGVGIYRTDQDPIVLGTPDGGEYAGQTRFLTMSETISSNFFGRFRFALVDDFAALVLMTDGITDPKFQTDNNLNRREKWDELWADLNQGITFTDDATAPDQLQQWLTFWSPGNHDDRTIALLYRHASNAKN